MKCFVLVAFCVQLALSLPQGYNYNNVGPVDLNVGGFKPVLGVGAPCNHGPSAAAQVQQQSVGRIIHHGSGHGDSQAVTLNSHITVGGEGGHSHTQSFQNNQGYAEQGRPAAIPLPLPGPAPSFLQNSFGSSGSFSSGHGSSGVSGGGRIPSGPSSHGLSGGYSSGGFGGGGGSGFGGGGGSGFGGGPRPQINSNFIAGGSGHSSGGGGGGHYQGSGSSYQNVGGFSGGSQFQSGFGQQQQSGGFSQGSASQSFGQSASFGGNGILNGALGNVIRETFASAPLDPTVEKHIYVHVPPEDLEENQSRQQIRPEAAAKKHYKIIFIKAPTVSQSNNYAQIANVGQTEEKTIVYVLVKKPEEPSYEELQQIQQTSKPSKPEVYFIKYKTRNEQLGGGGGSIGGGGAGGFLGGSYSNIEQSSVGGGGGGHSHIESIGGSIGGGQFAGSEIDGGVDIRGNGAGSSIVSSHQEGGASFSSSAGSSGSSSFSTGSASGSVNIGETGPQHEVYGVPAE